MKRLFLLFYSTILFVVQLFPQNIHTLILQPGPEDGIDAYINSAGEFSNRNFGECISLISSAYTYQGQYGIGKSLLKFDLSMIPEDAEILSASLSLYYDPVNGHGVQTGTNASYLKRIVTPWEEMSVTMNTCPEVTNEHQINLPTSINTEQDYPDIDITELLNDMIGPGNNNFGLMMEMITTDPYASMIFASSDNPFDRLRPKLEIHYQGCIPPNALFEIHVENNHLTLTNNSENASAWHWDFGDGNTSDLFEPEHDYLNHGTYLVCLTAINDCDSVTDCDSTTVCENVVPDFLVNQLNDSLFVFSDNSPYSTNWEWDFGDGTSALGQTTSHIYVHSGHYIVCHKVSNDCSQDSICLDVSVCYDVRADFGYTLVNDSVVAFHDQSSEPLSWYWDFGDGSVSVVPDPVHIFRQSGNFNVCCTVENECSADVHCERIDILLIPPAAAPPLILAVGSDEVGFKVALPDSSFPTILVVNDLKGKVVASQTLEPGTSVAHFPLKEQGIYILVVSSGDYRHACKIFVP